MNFSGGLTYPSSCQWTAISASDASATLSRAIRRLLRRREGSHQSPREHPKDSTSPLVGESPALAAYVLAPPILLIGLLANLARRMHVGHVNAYAAYVLLTMLLVLVLGAGIL